jgi:hypothetical protein
MKRVMKAVTVAVVAMALAWCLTSCTENIRARSWGGTTEVNLPPGQKLVDVTWKGNDLWYMYRPAVEGERIETYVFREDSSFGIMEGKVIFKEMD